MRCKKKSKVSIHLIMKLLDDVSRNSRERYTYIYKHIYIMYVKVQTQVRVNMEVVVEVLSHISFISYTYLILYI